MTDRFVERIDTVLTQRQLAVQHEVSRERLRSGFNHASFEVVPNHVRDSMVASLNAYVLTDQAGNTITKRRDRWHTEVLKPWWLPNAIWKRLPRVSVQTTTVLTVEPTNYYRDSSIPVPELGKPVVIQTWALDTVDTVWKP